MTSYVFDIAGNAIAQRFTRRNSDGNPVGYVEADLAAPVSKTDLVRRWKAERRAKSAIVLVK